MISEALQAHLVYLRQRGAPYPLSDSQGNLQALALWTEGLSYGSIARIMRIYHGFTLTPAGWQSRLRREMGVPPRHHQNGNRRVSPTEAS
jgi:hypothetical protein